MGSRRSASAIASIGVGVNVGKLNDRVAPGDTFSIVNER
jgi:hypothetical protein